MMEKSKQISSMIKKTKEGSQCMCLLIILINSVYIAGRNLSSSVFKKCKDFVKGATKL